jgi:hypothetical protein
MQNSPVCSIKSRVPSSGSINQYSCHFERCLKAIASDSVSGLRIIDSNAQTGITWWNWTIIQNNSYIKELL